MSFENPARGRAGDAGQRDRERAAKADPLDVEAQERYFAALCRVGRANDQEAQRLLFSALNERVGSEAAVLRMNEIFDEQKTGLRGAYVPVERPTIVADGTPLGEPQTPVTLEHRWVFWKRVYRPQTEAEKQASRTANEDENRLVEIPGSIEKIVQINVPSATQEQLIDAGDYDWINPDIAAQGFPFESATSPREVYLVRLTNRIVRTEEIWTWFLANNLASATFKELLTIGAQLPDEQRRVYIVAIDPFGQMRAKKPQIPARLPALYRHIGERNLHLCDALNQWNEIDRFLAAPQV